VAAARATAHHDFCVSSAALYECCVQQCSATFVCTEHYRQHWQSGTHNDVAVHTDDVSSSGTAPQSVGEVSLTKSSTAVQQCNDRAASLLAVVTTASSYKACIIACVRGILEALELCNR
jgi:hypothetical protein